MDSACVCEHIYVIYLTVFVNMTAYCWNTVQEWHYACLEENYREGRQESCDLSFSRTWTCSWNVFLLLPGAAEKHELTLNHPRQPASVLRLPLWKTSHKVRRAMERHSQDSPFHKWKVTMLRCAEGLGESQKVSHGTVPSMGNLQR